MSERDLDCRIEAVVTVDSKGQFVLPKDLREKAGFEPNGKIALVSFEEKGKVYCVLLIKTEKLSEAVTKALSLFL